MLNPDYKDMLSAFSAASVEYLLIGAQAVAVHGRPRATGDIDLWVRPNAENARRVMAALAAFGAPIRDLTAADLEQPGLIVQFGVEPCRIDILTAISGVEFEPAWKNRMVVELEGIKVNCLGRAELIASKRAAGRPKDLADLAALAEPD